MNLVKARVGSPLGTVELVLGERGLRRLDFVEGQPEAAVPPEVEGVATALRGYFEGRLDALAGVSLDLEGSEFQRRVWALLREIPAGTTTSYVALARALGRPGAARAVGRANATNPVAIAVPCHRVVAASGALSGYAGGVEKKRWLLEHERRLVQTADPAAHPVDHAAWKL